MALALLHVSAMANLILLLSTLSFAHGLSGSANYTAGYLHSTYRNNGGLCDRNVGQAHGYFKVDPKNPKRQYFFWFFESRRKPKTDPIFLYLAGGPGESGIASAVGSNGPCMVNAKGTATTNNPYSWTTQANGIWLDQPVGVGFSKGQPAELTSAETVENIYRFLESFFAKYPKYKGDLYIAGESYAGHLMPQLAHILKQGSKPLKNLKGIIFVNTIVNSKAQTPSYPEMAFNSKSAKPAISKLQYDAMKKELPGYLQLVDQCNRDIKRCPKVSAEFERIFLDPLITNGVDFYRLDQKCSDKGQHEPGGCNDKYEMPDVGEYLNKGDVKSFLGVSGAFVLDSEAVFQQLIPFAYVNTDFFLPKLLQSGVRVLTIAGDLDYICNYMGLKEWMLGISWSGQKAFQESKDVEFKDGAGKVVGLRRSVSKGQYQFVQVYGGSHVPVRENPRGVLKALNDFL